MKIINVGDRFGSLVTIRQTDDKNSSRCIIWECLCDCGNLKKATSTGLRREITHHCGCKLRRRKDEEQVLRRNTKDTDIMQIEEVIHLIYL